MKLILLIQALTVDPVQLNLKAKILSMLACFCAIFFVALTTQSLAALPNSPILVASMGATAVILFFIPDSPLAQPWPVFSGQVCSAFVGMSIALYISETASSAAAAVGGSVLLMLLLRCLHPPATATALAPVMSENISELGYSFLLIPVGINVGLMVLLAIIINRWVLNRDYPSAFATEANTTKQNHTAQTARHKIGISTKDIEQALQNSDSFVDITATKLSHLLSNTEMNTFKRVRGNIICADIMERDICTVEYGTEVEDAWQIMQTEKTKVIPVVDSVNRVIGIITQHDFFKYINLNAYDNLQEQLRSFIRRTAHIKTSKPEAVGHIMSRTVVTLAETAHIVELIPLMTLQGHRQIPIINDQHRLVGMVYQANLVAALYHQGLAQSISS
ncbi:CBS domain-containing membrane protein [Bathymodiolus japonicus methanotrophic gill symbiont]|uniref:HPP family protein n=1 Tax=Bathymodiolus japonicus methanotrophic gill symbiont TaxID=113269 RepID=UPI001B6824CD|nr:HPP family protein [Bathymodiolus japonicus methanotrophic gill symbiont]GFO71212.1 CBS domain-containing membrane protein [Bathymodiolus japonicus methanotrophic gill symbiont]